MRAFPGDWKAIGEAIGNDWKGSWKWLEKQFGSNWKGTEERLESKENIIGKQLKIFGNFLEQFLANYSNVWQHLVIYGISFTWLEIVWKAILKRIKLIGKRLESDWKAIGILLESNWKFLAFLGAVFGKLKQWVASFGNLWYFLHLIGNCLESNFKENKTDWESDWKAKFKREK